MTARPPPQYLDPQPTCQQSLYELRPFILFKNSVHQCAQAEEESARSLMQVILQVGQIFTLSYFDKFYMVTTFLDAMNSMVSSVSPSEFYIFRPSFSMEV